VQARLCRTQAHDAAAQLSLTVKQTQRVTGSVGVFSVPVESPPRAARASHPRFQSGGNFISDEQRAVNDL
jgi:hypothetical protein